MPEINCPAIFNFILKPYDSAKASTSHYPAIHYNKTEKLLINPENAACHGTGHSIIFLLHELTKRILPASL